MRFWGAWYDIDHIISADIEDDIANMTDMADIDDIDTKIHWFILIPRF